MRPRWRKVLADLGGNKTRTLLVVLSIAVGVFATGAVATAYQFIGEGMDTSYRAIHPANAVVYIYTVPFNQNFVDGVRHMPGVEEAEGAVSSNSGALRLQTGPSQWRDLNLIAQKDLAARRLDRLNLLAGAWPESRQIMLESTTAELTNASVGDIVVVDVGNNKLRELGVSGLVQDLTLAPGSQTVNGYVTLKTMEWLGQPREFTELHFRVSDPAPTVDSIRVIGRRIEAQIARSGQGLSTTIVLPPNRHPAASSVEAILKLLGVLAFLAVGLSGFLVSNTFSALLTQHIRQIGIMKAVGARTRQIVGMYLVLVVSLGVLAFVLAAPLAALVGYGLAVFVAWAVNFNLTDFRLLPFPLALMATLSLLAPIAASLMPVFNGARLTIREAISGYGLGSEIGHSLIDRAFAALRSAPRPLLISLRNTVRRKARLGLTLITLVLGGAIFMGMFNTRLSMFRTLDQILSLYLSDVTLDFDRDYRIEEIQQVAQQSPGVMVVEGWTFAQLELFDTNNKSIDRFDVLAPPADSQLVKPEVIAGRWLNPSDQNALVISTAILKRHPYLKIGDTIRVKLKERKYPFVIVGVFLLAETDGSKLAYGNYTYLAETLGQIGRASTYRIGLAAHDPESQAQAAQALADQFKSLGYDAVVLPGSAFREGVATTLNAIIGFLLFMALLIAGVGGLGLMGTMSMNVLERTREIGVMRAVGASDKTVRQIVIVEGILIGLMSWLAGVLLSLPMGLGFSRVMGQSLFDQPLAFAFAWEGVAIWLALVIVIALLSSLLPAHSASRLTVREALAYE